MDNWTEQENRAAIIAYKEMQSLHSEGSKFVKTEYYRQLSMQFGRTEKAYGRRMSNISAVLSLQGKDWLPGLKPLFNVGSNVVYQIERILAELEKREINSDIVFESEVLKAKKTNSNNIPEGIQKPSQALQKTTSYQRDPKVKAWVLKESNGFCENCGNPAPFMTDAKEPFLEVHHVIYLSDGGSDTTHNAIALCPNCHSAFHYSTEKVSLTQKIYSKIKRLKN